MASALLFTASYASAGELHDRFGNVIFGKISEINNSFVTIEPGCKGVKRKYRWSRIDVVLPNSNCKAQRNVGIGGSDCEESELISRQGILAIVFGKNRFIFSDIFGVFYTDQFLGIDKKMIHFKDIRTGERVSLKSKHVAIRLTDEYCKNP